MGITEEEAFVILEKAFPDILYKDMKQAVTNLRTAGIVIDNRADQFKTEQSAPGIKIIPGQATAEEIAEWEKYNGEGSFSNGSSPKFSGDPIQVKDEKTFKSIFNRG